MLPYEGHHNSAVFPGYERSSVGDFRLPDRLRIGWRCGARRCTRMCVAWRLLCPADVPTRSDV